jgi:hypothetical protein
MNQKSNKLDAIVSKARQDADIRAKGYREQALKMYPWVCAKCSREFTHKNLQELEVHHKNSDHDDNPPDGSNWELLCTYCHEHEHTKFSQSNGKLDTHSGEAIATHNPFANLKSLLGKPD